jgi:hypothetical protein
MTVADTDGSRIKSVEATDSDPKKKYGRWKDEIAKAEKEMAKFREKGRHVVRRFKDERDGADAGERRFNIFTVNVGIMASSLYSKIPKVSVNRRFGQPNDDVARVASLMLQQTVMQDIDEPDCDFDQVMRDAIQDRLVPGLGQAWLRLENETTEETLESEVDEITGDVVQEASTYEKIAYQCVKIEHVNWEDFLYSPCRTYAERRWVGRRVYMDQDALVKRFGEDVGKKIPLDYNPKSTAINNNQPENELIQKAVIYEIWDRVTRTVLWLNKGYPDLLDEKEDPLGLDDFEPCPKPLMALTTTSNCIPTADFVLIQDQYNELDTVNNRISLLIDACKVVGVYDAANTGVQRMLQQGTENTLIPVDNWAMFAEKGGVKGTVDWLPLDVVITALARLREAREDIKGQIYELTGLSDIVRGQTKASETLGAQQLKSQYASVRIQSLQDDMVKFAQQVLRIKAEIICRHFVKEQLLAQSNMQYSSDAQNIPLIEAAVALIKGNPERMEWRVKVQADSMAQVDKEVMKKEKVEFTNAVATFLQSAATTLKAMPDTAPILFETLKYAVSGFSGATELEGVIDENLKVIMQKIQNPPPPPPDPAVEKAKMEMQQSQQEFQQKSQLENQKAQLEMQKGHQELALEQQRGQNAMVEHQQTLAQKEQMHEMALQQQAEKHAQSMQQAQDKFDAALAQSSAKNMQEIANNARADAAASQQGE